MRYETLYFARGKIKTMFGRAGVKVENPASDLEFAV